MLLLLLQRGETRRETAQHRPYNVSWNTMVALEMAKWLMLIPMSFQLPKSLTRKRKVTLVNSDKQTTSTMLVSVEIA